LLPIETIDTAVLSDGTQFTLARRGDEWFVRVGPALLMSSRYHESEEALALEALARCPSPKSVLIGGLGLGFTLRALLDRVARETAVTVCELVPKLVAWNREHVGALANHPLSDPRSRVVVGDVFEQIRGSEQAWDLILLDVDNGPIALSSGDNQRLYDDKGVRACLRALRPGAVLAVWSTGPNRRFKAALGRVGFAVEELFVPAVKNGRARHVIFLARAPRRAR
jgi:spermidine synthase